MRNLLQSLVFVSALALAACNRQAGTGETNSTPAVAPPDTKDQALPKHYTQADYAQACYPYPTAAVLQQYSVLTHQTGQAAIDAEYERLHAQYPYGECNSLRQSASAPAQSTGGWVEGGKANDMSHYGDALSGKKP